MHSRDRLRPRSGTPARGRRPAKAERNALLDELWRHREEQTAAYVERARALASPCVAGCHGCCHQLVLVELPDALLIARYILAAGAATVALRRALEENAALVERLTPDETFARGGGCVFLDPRALGAACTIYKVRPNDCRTWFIHGVPDGSGCEPGAPARERSLVALPELEEADVGYGERWVARFGTGLEQRPVWAPLALAVRAALDLVERGPASLARWRGRLDEATQRSYGFFEEEPPPRTGTPAGPVR